MDEFTGFVMLQKSVTLLPRPKRMASTCADNPEVEKEEIRHLVPGETVQVVRYVRTLDDGQPSSGPELTELANRLAEDPSPDESQKNQIHGGFYGS